MKVLLRKTETFYFWCWEVVVHFTQKMKAEEKRICRSTICWWVAVVTHPVRLLLLRVAFSIPHLYLQASLICINARKAIHGTSVRVHALTWCMQKVWCIHYCSKAWAQQDDVLERSFLCFNKKYGKNKESIILLQFSHLCLPPKSATLKTATVFSIYITIITVNTF